MLVPAVDDNPVCGLSLMEMGPFLKWEYHWNVWNELSAVTPNAYGSISYFSVAIYKISSRT